MTSDPDPTPSRAMPVDPNSMLLAFLDVSCLWSLARTIEACKPALRRILTEHPDSTSRLALDCGIPHRRLARHLAILARHGVVHFEKIPGQRAARPCSRYSRILIHLDLRSETFELRGVPHAS